MKEADGLVWGTGKDRYVVRVEKTKPEVEIIHYNVKVSQSDGKLIHAYDFWVDLDMYGGGFVKAIQADSDPEREIIVWGRHEYKQSFLLDFSEGNVVEKTYDLFSGKTKDLIFRWSDLYIMRPRANIFLGFVLIGYYFICGIIWLIVRLFSRKKK
ncbi:MAG: hypothetical protein V2A66_08235 [Pseudomonadota bacterium]